MKIGVLILAAGGSSRLGRPKQLITFEGKTLLARSLEAVSDGGTGPIVVVLGANAELIATSLEATSNVHIAVHEDWARGMGHSIAFGVKALLERGNDLSHLLVSVCDQPYLKAEHVGALYAAAEDQAEAIVVSDYGESMGPPVLFPQSYFEKLLGLTGDRGAKSILQECKHALLRVNFPAGKFDIDDEADLRALEQKE